MRIAGEGGGIGGSSNAWGNGGAFGVCDQSELEAFFRSSSEECSSAGSLSDESGDGRDAGVKGRRRRRDGGSGERLPALPPAMLLLSKGDQRYGTFCVIVCLIRHLAKGSRGSPRHFFAVSIRVHGVDLAV